MNNSELKEMFDNIKVGDTFYNIAIEGLNENDVDSVLQELARKNNVQFYIKTNYYSGKKELVYEVVNPSKKFLNREGQWSMAISKTAKDFLTTLEL